MNSVHFFSMVPCVKGPDWLGEGINTCIHEFFLKFLIHNMFKENIYFTSLTFFPPDLMTEDLSLTNLVQHPAVYR